MIYNPPFLDRGIVAQCLYGHLPFDDAIKEADRVVAFLADAGIVSKPALATDLPFPYSEGTLSPTLGEEEMVMPNLRPIEHNPAGISHPLHMLILKEDGNWWTVTGGTLNLSGAEMLEVDRMEAATIVREGEMQSIPTVSPNP